MRQLKIHQGITDRSESSTEKYLQEINKFPLISAEEETILAQQIKIGGSDAEKAHDKLVKANLRFVVSVAKQYQRQWLSIGDLINEWNLGLIKAASRFDETRGFKFISYAVWRIRQSILQAISDSWNMIRLPSNKETARRKLEKFSDIFMQEYEREPTQEELAEISWSPIEEVSMLLRPKKHASLDKPIGQDEWWDVTFGDMMTDSEENILDVLLIDDIRRGVTKALHTLSPREKDVVAVFFWIGEEVKKALHITLSSKDEFCNKYNVTHEQAKNIKNRVLQRLATMSKNTSTTFGEVTQDKKPRKEWKPRNTFDTSKVYVQEIQKNITTKQTQWDKKYDIPTLSWENTTPHIQHHNIVQTQATQETMMVLSPALASTMDINDRKTLQKLVQDPYRLQVIAAKNQGDKAIATLLPELMAFLSTKQKLHEDMYDDFHIYLTKGGSGMLIWHSQLQKFLKDMILEGAWL
jgi:RNA polymerase primary sigma factor